MRNKHEDWLKIQRQRKKRHPNPFGTTKKSRKKSGCYIATAVYGSYDCSEVWTLRRFRDNTLENSFWGRLFITCYYAISPTIVFVFKDSKCFSCFWKKRLDRIVSYLNSKGVSNQPYND